MDFHFSYTCFNSCRCIYRYQFKYFRKPDYKNVSLKEYKQKISSQNSYFMYVYKTSCGVCQEMKPSMNKVIKQEKAEILL